MPFCTFVNTKMRCLPLHSPFAIFVIQKLFLKTNTYENFIFSIPLVQHL